MVLILAADRVNVPIFESSEIRYSRITDAQTHSNINNITNVKLFELSLFPIAGANDTKTNLNKHNCIFLK